jgi:hypothetical protein
MKKFILVFSMLLLSVSACAPTATPTEQPLVPDMETPASELTPAQQAAIERLSSTLSLPADQVSILSTEAVEWPDGCLGIQREGVMCTQAIVPGFKFILQADDKTYEVRTNKSGTQAVVVLGTPPSGLLEQALVAQLAYNLRLQEQEISIVSSSEMEFTDACLGVALFEETCAQVVTAGKVVVLAANGFEFEYRVSEDGALVQPATLALTWTREGGIAGFCNSLTVFLSGEAYGRDCRTETDQTRMAFADLISTEEQNRFFDWMREFESTQVDASDPEGVADRMIVRVEFFGAGVSEWDDPARQALFEFAQSLYGKLFP